MPSLSQCSESVKELGNAIQYNYYEWLWLKYERREWDNRTAYTVHCTHAHAHNKLFEIDVKKQTNLIFIVNSSRTPINRERQTKREKKREKWAVKELTPQHLFMLFITFALFFSSSFHFISFPIDETLSCFALPCFAVSLWTVNTHNLNYIFRWFSSLFHFFQPICRICEYFCFRFSTHSQQRRNSFFRTHYCCCLCCCCCCSLFKRNICSVRITA